MPTLTDLGQLVKAKYPAYASLPDEEVGRRVREKYPDAYQEYTETQVSAPAPTREQIMSTAPGVPFYLPTMNEIRKQESWTDKLADVYNMPGQGVNQAIEGGRKFAIEAANVAQGKPSSGKRAAVSDVVEGTAQAALPFLPVLAAAAPAEAAFGLIAGGGMMKGARWAGEKAGYSPETVRLIENLAAGAPISLAAISRIGERRFLGGISAKMDSLMERVVAGDIGAQAQVKALAQRARQIEALSAKGVASGATAAKEATPETATRPDVFERAYQLGPTAETIPERLLGRTPLQKRLQSELGPLAGTVPSKISGARRTHQGGMIGIPIESVKKLQGWVDNTATEWVDRFDPIRRLVKDKNLTAESDPYVAARMYAGHVGKVDNRLQDLRSVLRPATEEGLLDKAVQYAQYERFEELATPVPSSKNAARIEGIKEFPGGKTIEQLKQEKAAFEASVTPEELTRMKEIGTQVREYTRRLADESYEAGVISGASRNHLSRAENEKYMPMQRLSHMADELERGTINTGSNAFNVSSQSLYRRIKGGTSEVANPLEQVIRSTYKTVAMNERNKVALKVADLEKLPEFKGIVTKVTTKGSAVPAENTTFYVLRDGMAEQYSAPKAVVDAMKGLNDKQVDTATRFASVGTRALRAGATSMNLAFFVPNAIRDAQTAKLVSKTGFGVRDWLGGFAEAIRRGDDFRQFMEQGASFSGFFERQGGAPQALRHLTESGTRKVARKVLNPVELMRIMGETTELAPRLGVFKRSTRMGMTPYEAAFNARNATIDFAKSGNTMRIFNMWIPFLNARLQGTLNTFGALKRNPLRGGMIVGYTIAAPALATYATNHHFFPDVMNDIAQWEKDNNFIFVYGNDKDSDGNYTQVIKIPKGDVGRMFGNPIENFLEFVYGNDPKGARELTLQVLSDISPVGFEKEGKGSGLTALSGIAPPAIRGLGEVATNRKWYFDSPVIPRSLEGAPPAEQYTATTPSYIRGIASGLASVTKPTLGSELSPIEVGHMVEAQLGGVGRQIGRGEMPWSAAGRRFLGATGGAEVERGHRRMTELQTEERGGQVRESRTAQQVYDELAALPVGKRRERAVQILSQPGGKELLDKVSAIATETELTSLESRLQSGKGGSVKVRAQMVYEQLSRLSGPKQRRALYLDWKKKKIITDAVDEQLLLLIQQP